MDPVPLKDLNLASRWPKLAKLWDDLAEFQSRHRKADAQVSTLRSRLPHAREEDLAAEAAAVRAGKKPPEPTREPAVQRDLDRASRERDVLARTIQAVHEDLGAFMAEHQATIFEDVANARAGVAERLAGHARAALSEYGRYQDLGRHAKRLRPAEPVNENAPTQRSTYVFAGVHTTRSAGPAPGDVEAMLAYLVSLGAEEEGGANDAA